LLRRLSLPAIQEPWQRTLYVTFFGQLVSAAAFSIIFPFLPLYVEYLGTTTGLSPEFWAGMVISSQAITITGAVFLVATVLATVWLQGR
jgi:hypothetical protein